MVVARRSTNVADRIGGFVSEFVCAALPDL
jgi:hypothetical protein